MRSSTTVEEYLAGVEPATFRNALLALRAILRDELPDADEVISYGIPTFKMGKKNIFHYGAFTKHCTFFTGTVHEAFAEQLGGFKTTKGGIHFTPDHMIPEQVVREIARATLLRSSGDVSEPG